MAIQSIICVFLHAAVVRPATITPTSAPRTTVYKIPDVLLQPPKMKTDSFWKTSSGSSPQTRAEAGKTFPRIDPGRSQTNKSITAITPSVSQTRTDALRKTQGINFSPSKINTDTAKNNSGIASEQIKPDQSKISNTIVQTPTVAQPSGSGRAASGEPDVSCFTQIKCPVQSPHLDLVVLQCFADRLI